MARRATIIGETIDINGEGWDVRERRPTLHGFDVLLGWPQKVPRGPGGGSPRVILTEPLACYLAANCHNPLMVNLPIGHSTVKRLRKLLDLNWYTDNDQWWYDRRGDLMSMTLEAFCAKHGKTPSAASHWRKFFRQGPIRK